MAGSVLSFHSPIIFHEDLILGFNDNYIGGVIGLEKITLHGG